MKNTGEGIKSRLDEAEDKISELKDKIEKNTPERARKGKKTKEVLRELQGNMKCNKIHMIGIQKEKKKSKG